MMASGGLIMGLDIAGRTGVAEGIAGSVPHLYSELFKLEDDDGPLPAYGRAIKWMAKRCAREDAPVAIYVEGVIPDVFLKGQTHHDAHMIKVGLYGCLTGVAMAKSIPVFPVSIGKYRKAFIGYGNLGPEGKQIVFNHCRVLGWDPPDLDSSDAAAIWAWGCAQSDGFYQKRMRF
jgi:hypothetical protein